MKRSTMVALALVAGAGGAAYWAYESSQAMEITLSDNATLVDSVDQCVAVTSFSRSECQEAYDRALTEAQAEVAPLATKEACEEKYGAGQCEIQQVASNANTSGETTRSGTGMWLPLMTGFLIRDALIRSGSNGARGFVSQPTFGGRTAAAGATGAGTAARSFALSDGSRYQANARGAAMVPSAKAAGALSRQQTAITTRAAPAMRGGFGSSGRSATS